MAIVDITYKVVASALNVRVSPDASAKLAGASIPNGTNVRVTETQKDTQGNTWGKHSTGWSAISYGKNIYLEQVSTTSAPATNTTDSKTINDGSIYTKEEVAQIRNTITETYKVISDVQFKLQTARSIMGMPHQFLETADERIPGSKFGRLFTENILMDMPICTVIPGGPRFLAGKGINDKDRSSLAQVLANAASAPAETMGNLLEDVLGGKNARYYSFETQFAEYMKYVNTLNRITSLYLGIRKSTLRKGMKTYENMTWDAEAIEVNAQNIFNLIGAHGALTFYFDKGGSSMSESSSNSTDKSMLEGAMNNASNMAKEAEFLFGVGAGRVMDSMNEQLAEQRIDTLTNSIAGSKGIMNTLWNNLKSGVTTTFAGANMLLPEIWRDSNFSRSYSLDVHLATPYGIPEAFFLDVAVPLNFLLALSLPRQFGANAFYAPFLIQAFSNGIFNCSLGMVDQISITRFGSGDSISRIGLPLEIKVSITFKDLYGAMALSKSDSYTNLMNNTALLDFIANLTALNLNQPDLTRKLQVFLTGKIDKIMNIPGNFKNIIFDSIRNELMRTIKY